jgi:FkbM family methyltransferase
MSLHHFSVVNILSHCFIPEFIRPGGIAIDCGANEGGFSRWLSENTTTQVHAFEADPTLFTLLPQLDRVTFHNLAIDGEAGTMELHRTEGYCSSGFYTGQGTSAGSVIVPKIAFADFIRTQGIERVDLLKLDIEGSEIPLLKMTPDDILERISQITVEFHDFINPEDLPRIHQIDQRLRALGFKRVKFSRGVWANCLFVNTHIQPFSQIDTAAAMIKGWAVPGMRRRLTKLTRRGLP